MTEVNKILATLSPAKRALVEQYLLERDEIGAEEDNSILRRQDSENIPLSFTQQRLWILDQLAPGSAVYNTSAVFQISGQLDVERLEKSLNEIVKRHEALRTIFLTDQDTPVQVILPPVYQKVQVAHLLDLREAQREKELWRMVSRQTQKPFDLTKDILLRASLLQLEDTKHVLILVAHHIASDGWSKGVLYRELSLLYKSFSSEKASPLPELPVQYADFAVWQRQRMNGENLVNQLAYWRDQLAGATHFLELPTDHPRPATQAFKGARYSWTLPLSLVAALKKLSQKEGVTLFMLLLSGFKVLLYRYTGQVDVSVGTAIANRTQSEIENLIGFFANTLVLRTELSGNPPFRTILDRVRKVCLGAYAHQDMPFEKLVEEIQPERTLSYSPLFQVMLILQNTPRTPLELDGLELTSLEVDNRVARFDVTLSMTEQEGGLDGVWEYDTALFNEATIERMASHFQILLEGIVADPEQSISELPLLPEMERQHLLVNWNDTKTDYPRNTFFYQLFEQQVLLNPSRIAVEYGDNHISYDELNCKANQLAHYLRDVGVGPNVLVGLFVDRSIEMMVGLLGILKAGGAYVPLDPAYPQERLSYMLKESKSPVVITQSKCKSNLPESDALVVCIDSDWDRISQMRNENPVSASKNEKYSTETLAYVIFTSGSTGVPKGVQVPHRAVTNFLISMSQTPGVAIDDTLLAVTTLSFDIHVLELFTPLIVGAKVVIASHENTLDGRQLTEILAKKGVTVMQATPSTWRLMIAAGWKGTSHLRVLCGGEAFPKDLAGELIDRVGSLWNMYGPTETTVWSTCYHIKNTEGPLLVGRPIANTSTYVLDDRLQPVPVGVPGELYIGGDGVSHGYLNRPDLTDEAFIPDPFSQIPNAFIYKTGDLVKYHPDGHIEYLNRLDNQVKVRGFRIELGEIEAAVDTYSAIKQTIAGVKECNPGDHRLICFYRLKDNLTIDLRSLRAHLRNKIPDYMIPQQFVELKEFPLTPAGKIDRKALMSRQITSAGQEKNYVPPRSPIEKDLVHIWSQVLGVDQVGTSDNFFELGGHSLLGTMIISRVVTQFQVDMAFKTLFQAPTVADMATAVIKLLAHKNRSKDLDNVISEIETLSNEEVRRNFDYIDRNV